MNSKHLFVVVIILCTLIMIVFVFISATITLAQTEYRSQTYYLCLFTGAPVGVILMIIPPMKLFMMIEDRAIRKIHKRLGGDYSHTFSRTTLIFDDLELRTRWGDFVFEYIGLNISWVRVRRKENKDWDVGPDVVEGQNNEDYCEHVRAGLKKFYLEGFDISKVESEHNGNVKVKMNFFMIDDELIVKFIEDMKALLESGHEL